MLSMGTSYKAAFFSSTFIICLSSTSTASWSRRSMEHNGMRKKEKNSQISSQNPKTTQNLRNCPICVLRQPHDKIEAEDWGQALANFQSLCFEHFKTKMFGRLITIFSFIDILEKNGLQTSSPGTEMECGPERTQLMKLLGSNPASTSWGICDLLLFPLSSSSSCLNHNLL